MIAGALGAVARFILGEPETGAKPAAVEKDSPGILAAPSRPVQKRISQNGR